MKRIKSALYCSRMFVRTADNDGIIEERKRCHGKYNSKLYPCIPIHIDKSTCSQLQSSFCEFSCFFCAEAKKAELSAKLSGEGKSTYEDLGREIVQELEIDDVRQQYLIDVLFPNVLFPFISTAFSE